MRSLRKERSEAGQCRECGATKRKDRTKCALCLEIQRQRMAEHQAKARREMLIAYGSKCWCCGEDIPEFLTLDHTMEKSRKEDKAKGNGVRLYTFLRRLGWPREGRRLACFNCNCGRERNGGICPHELIRGR